MEKAITDLVELKPSSIGYAQNVVMTKIMKEMKTMSNQIHTRVSDEEKAKLKEEASETNMTLQDYCWTRLIKTPEVFIQLQQLLKGGNEK